MPRKDGSTLKPKAVVTPQSGSPRERSWVTVGVDTSLTAISVCVYGFDSITNTYKGAYAGEIRWPPETEYFERLSKASRVNALVNSLVAMTWARNPVNTFVGIEEAVPFGMVGKGLSGWLIQQAEFGGVVKASLYNAGYENIVSVNNSSWHKTLREQGVKFLPIPRGTPKAEKAKISLANKFLVKTSMMEKYGLPDYPDLVASKTGAKIPRPESGFGANAKAVQPDDRVDAAAVMNFLIADLTSRQIIEAPE